MDSAELFLAMHDFNLYFQWTKGGWLPWTRFCHVSVPVILTETSYDIFNPSKEILGEYSNYATTYNHINSPAAYPVQQKQQVW